MNSNQKEKYLKLAAVFKVVAELFTFPARKTHLEIMKKATKSNFNHSKLLKKPCNKRKHTGKSVYIEHMLRKCEMGDNFLYFTNVADKEWDFTVSTDKRQKYEEMARKRNLNHR